MPEPTPQRPFTIRLFLPDGDPSGRRIAVRSHHTAEVYYVTRAQFPSLGTDSRLGRTGVYVLVGPSDSETHELKIYIGQSGRLGERIKSHLKGTNAKDWWTEVYLLTKTDGELDQADVDHLEARLIRLARDARRLEIDNTNNPNPPPLPDHKDADVSALIVDVLPIYKALGLRAFEPAPAYETGQGSERPPGSPEEVPLFLSAVGISGEGRSTRNGFVVLAGATIRKTETATISSSVKRKRQQLVTEDHLRADDNTAWTLISDHTFRSASEAACVLTGSSVSGPSYWRTSSGKSLNELEYGEATTTSGVDDSVDGGTP